MPRLLVRLLGLPAVIAAAALIVADPRPLAGSESLEDQELFAAAGDPDLLAVHRDLNAQLGEVSVRTAMKEDLVDRLLDSNLALVAAADGFLTLNGAAPGCLEVMRQNFPASDDRESAARNVLEYVRQRVNAEDWPRVSARLVAEFRAAFHHSPRL